jgi:multimeric flavodoxin WrbA
MRIVCINGSPRQNGNTAIMLRRVAQALEAGGHETEEIFLDELDLAPCRACMICAQEKDGKCHGYNDAGNELIEKARAADAILLGSPVYFGSITSQMKTFLDRVGFVSRVNGGYLKRKIGAAVSPARRTGQLLTFAELNMWFLINGMVVPGSGYWNIGQAKGEGEINQDEEAMKTLDELADNLLWLLEKTKS